MRRCETVSAGTLVEDYLDAVFPGVSEHLAEVRLVKNWPEVVGTYINRRTEKVEIRDHVLYVRISSAPLRNELFNGRQQLVQRLNDSVSHVTITDIRFN